MFGITTRGESIVRTRMDDHVIETDVIGSSVLATGSIRSGPRVTNVYRIDRGDDTAPVAESEGYVDRTITRVSSTEGRSGPVTKLLKPSGHFWRVQR